MKIVFFGTSNVALPILETLNQHHQILAAVTSPDKPVGRKQELQESPVSSLARDLNLKTIKPEKVKGNAEFQSEMQNLAADIFVVVSYGYILPEEIINMPRLKTVNVHFSLLPKYRGPSPIQYALLNGDMETGTTIFVLDKEVDHGPILAQEKVAIENDDNFITLGDRLARESAKLIIPTLVDYETDKIAPQEQDHGAATFTKIITKDDGKIDWNKSAFEIYNQFRAFFPWPGLWTTWQGQRTKILDCHALGESSGDIPGVVTDSGRVACGNGTSLQINSLQPAGKREMNILEFLNGNPGFVGSKLE